MAAVGAQECPESGTASCIPKGSVRPVQKQHRPPDERQKGGGAETFPQIGVPAECGFLGFLHQKTGTNYNIGRANLQKQSARCRFPSPFPQTKCHRGRGAVCRELPHSPLPAAFGPRRRGSLRIRSV